MPRVCLARVVALFRRSRGGDLDEEIRTHMRMAVEENRRRGMSPKDALRAARLSFGSVDGTIEACRDQRGVPVVETIGPVFPPRISSTIAPRPAASPS